MKDLEEENIYLRRTVKEQEKAIAAYREEIRKLTPLKEGHKNLEGYVKEANEEEIKI